MKVSKFWMAMILTLAAVPARAEHVRMTNPSAVALEAGGRALMYSISFDRVLNDDLVAGAGFGTTSMRLLDGSDANVSAVLIPVYANYYFSRDQGSLFATVGADFVANSGSVSNLKSLFGNVQFSTTPVIPTFGIGYENRGDSGILFRVAAYGVYAASINPWFGFTLGYAF